MRFWCQDNIFKAFVVFLLSIVFLFQLSTDLHSEQYDVPSAAIETGKIVPAEEWLAGKFGTKPPVWLRQELGDYKNWKLPLNSAEIGVHIDSIHKLNHVDQTFGFSGSIWARWRGVEKAWNGTEFSNPLDGLVFNALNATGLHRSKAALSRDRGQYQADISIDGEFLSSLDYRKFPFDDQEITLTFEPIAYDAYELIFTLAGDPTADVGFNRILDYSVSSVALATNIKVYPTDFGVLDYDPGETFASSFSTLTFFMSRSVLSSMYNYIFPLIIVVGLLLINSSSMSTERGIKLSLPPAVLLSVVLLHRSQGAELPNLDYLTYLDYLFICAYFVVFLCFFEASLFAINRPDAGSSTMQRLVQWRKRLLILIYSVVILGPFASWQIV